VGYEMVDRDRERRVGGTTMIGVSCLRGLRDRADLEDERDRWIITVAGGRSIREEPWRSGLRVRDRDLLPPRLDMDRAGERSWVDIISRSSSSQGRYPWGIGALRLACRPRGGELARTEGIDGDLDLDLDRPLREG